MRKMHCPPRPEQSERQHQELAEARNRLGLTKVEVSRLFHVQLSTVYRWETRPTMMDPFHRKLCEILVQISRYPRAAALGAQLSAAVATDEIQGLYLLLGMAFNDWARNA